MRNILLVACLFFTFSIFAQNESEESLNVPKSIFTVNFIDYQRSNYKVSSLCLTGHKFMIVDFFNNDFSFFNAGRIKLDLRNFGRHISFDDLTDNYNKGKLNSFDVSRNTNHFIWSMWDTRIQKQWQQDLQKK